MLKEIKHSIDWLQYTVDVPNYVKEWPLQTDAQMAIVHTCVPKLPVYDAPYSRPSDYKVNGIQGYTNTYDMFYCTVHVNPKHLSQKISVRMQGQDLGCYRDLGGTEAKLFDFIKGAKAAPSRIDIAFDLFGYGIDVSRMYSDWKRGKVRGHFRTVQPLTKGTVGEGGAIVEATTVYFGSRTSEVMVRIYEKGKQQNTELDWIRVELEIKGDKAKVVAEDCYRLGVGVVGRQMLREYFSAMPYKFWSELTQGASVELTSVGRKQTEREIWLHNVIFPLIAEEIAKEWDACEETGITRAVEALVREHWTTRAIAIRKQYGQM